MKEKLGDFFIDIAKYVVTAVVVTSLFSSFENGWRLVLLGLASSFVLLFIGFFVQWKVLSKRKGRRK